MRRPEQDRYTSGDVARIAGVSLRQLQWWDERNVVSPRQEGHRRVYLPQEVVEVSVIAELRRKGFSLQKIRRVLRFLQKEMGKRLSDAVANESEVHLITDGRNIYLEDHPDRDHRCAEECKAADVSGVRNRPVAAVSNVHGPQAGEIGKRARRVRQKRSWVNRRSGNQPFS